MYLAYIDEIGEPGPFASFEDKRFNTSPAFGYAGFVIPESEARWFGAFFTRLKRGMFPDRTEENPLFEAKGADVFYKNSPHDHPWRIVKYNLLMHELKRRGGRVFFYADEKPRGTYKQRRAMHGGDESKIQPEYVEAAAMRETLNRLAMYAEKQGRNNILVMIDQVTEKTRKERLHRMYAHVYGRSDEFPEMRRIIEPPMHIDSELSANIQCADWIAAFLSRVIAYQLVKEAHAFKWESALETNNNIIGDRDLYTWDSKVHLWNKSASDLHGPQVTHQTRPLHDISPAGEVLQKMAKKMGLC